MQIVYKVEPDHHGKNYHLNQQSNNKFLSLSLSLLLTLLLRLLLSTTMFLDALKNTIKFDILGAGRVTSSATGACASLFSLRNATNNMKRTLTTRSSFVNGGATRTNATATAINTTYLICSSGFNNKPMMSPTRATSPSFMQLGATTTIITRRFYAKYLMPNYFTQQRQKSNSRHHLKSANYWYCLESSSTSHHHPESRSNISTTIPYNSIATSIKKNLKNSRNYKKRINLYTQKISTSSLRCVKYKKTFLRTTRNTTVITADGFPVKKKPIEKDIEMMGFLENPLDVCKHQDILAVISLYVGTRTPKQCDNFIRYHFGGGGNKK